MCKEASMSRAGFRAGGGGQRCVLRCVSLSGASLRPQPQPLSVFVPLCLHCSTSSLSVQPRALYSQRSHTAKRPPRLCTMIRRPPTQIPMTDMDVQQVRDALARQKAEAAVKQHGTSATPAHAAPGTATHSQPYHHVDEAKKQREALTREQRLGMQS
ncbi:hypothetical protein C8Q79DRAFT_707077 [Trametes meyenii]|nr:hypothetical protein C8Q79DRAFT_707077 [Trametes meyenii]